MNKGLKRKINFLAKDVRGELLLEILIVIGVFAIIAPIVSQLILSSLNSNKWSVDNSVASELADETVATIESIAFEKWQNIYSLVKAPSSYYHHAKVGGAWQASSGDEAVTVNSINYTRYFTVSNVCRDNATKAIVTAAGVPPCTAGNSDDPSTQKMSVVVSWLNGSITKNVYLTRWRNKICNQTDWSGGLGTGVNTCPATVYDSVSSNIVITPGNIKLKAN